VEKEPQIEMIVLTMVNDSLDHIKMIFNLNDIDILEYEEDEVALKNLAENCEKWNRRFKQKNRSFKNIRKKYEKWDEGI